MLTNIYIMYYKCVFLKDLAIYMDGHYARSPMLSLEEISPQNGPPKKINKIIVKIIK